MRKVTLLTALVLSTLAGSAFAAEDADNVTTTPVVVLDASQDPSAEQSLNFKMNDVVNQETNLSNVTFTWTSTMFDIVANGGTPVSGSYSASNFGTPEDANGSRFDVRETVTTTSGAVVGSLVTLLNDKTRLDYNVNSRYDLVATITWDAMPPSWLDDVSLEMLKIQQANGQIDRSTGKDVAVLVPVKPWDMPSNGEYTSWKNGLRTQPQKEAGRLHIGPTGSANTYNVNDDASIASRFDTIGTVQVVWRAKGSLANNATETASALATFTIIGEGSSGTLPTPPSSDGPV